MHPGSGNMITSLAVKRLSKATNWANLVDKQYQYPVVLSVGVLIQHDIGQQHLELEQNALVP